MRFKAGDRITCNPDNIILVLGVVGETYECKFENIVNFKNYIFTYTEHQLLPYNKLQDKIQGHKLTKIFQD